MNRKILLTGLVNLLLCTASYADVIYLKNGRSYTGTIVRENKIFVRIEPVGGEGGSMREFLRSSIDRIEYGEIEQPDYGSLTEEEAPVIREKIRETPTEVAETPKAAVTVLDNNLISEVLSREGREVPVQSEPVAEQEEFEDLTTDDILAGLGFLGFLLFFFILFIVFIVRKIRGTDKKKIPSPIEQEGLTTALKIEPKKPAPPQAPSPPPPKQDPPPTPGQDSPKPWQ